MRTIALGAFLALLATTEPTDAKSKEFTSTFMIEACDFASEGTNPYFPLIPGHRMVLERPAGKKGDGAVVLTITVLHETVEVAGVTARVVEEHETEDGVLKEISRNFFAHCVQNGSVFYFGEDVDNYDETGTVIVNHDGAWRAGIDGAQPGVIMPGLPLVGARYFQEIAPDVALDRAEILSVSKTVETPAGTFTQCLDTKETSPLERRSKSFKAFAPGIGLIQDDDLLLESVGSVP